MKIVFNKVTWYSKLLAVFVFFVIIPAVSFYLGSYYEQTQILIKSIPAVVPIQNIQKIKPTLPIPKTNPVISTKPVKPIEGIACTQEAKLCPDGSYVGRTGPNCEFTPCSVLK